VAFQKTSTLHLNDLMKTCNQRTQAGKNGTS